MLVVEISYNFKENTNTIVTTVAQNQVQSEQEAMELREDKVVEEVVVNYNLRKVLHSVWWTTNNSCR